MRLRISNLFTINAIHNLFSIRRPPGIGFAQYVLHQDSDVRAIRLCRQQVIAFYTQLNRAYPTVDLLYVIQDNWNIHTHPDVMTALAKYPRIKPVWLPTYAPWLNPIEKLWRWVRQDILKMHRWVEDWPQVKQRVRDFLNQFAHGSHDLLRYVGLVGKGKLATVINTS